MKYNREEFARIIAENPNKEIMFIVSPYAAYSEAGYAVIEPECINIRIAKVCWIDEHGDKRLIERDEAADDSLTEDKYYELRNERWLEETNGIIDEVWKEAEEIVSKYEWFEAILVYIEEP